MSEKGEPTAIVIDDMSSIRNLNKMLLGSVGCNVVGEAENGELGLQLYLDLRPDLVLLDIEMPVKDGISTLKAILAEDAKANVVMVSTLSNMDVVEDCLFAGAKDYIRKDIAPPTIKARMEEVLSSILM
jgi:two-component system, chemotaxis family, chemotaxis protein CheY